MPRFTPYLCLTLILLPLVAVAIPPQIATEVANEAEPLAGIDRLVLEPVWRLGGKDGGEDDDVFFGVIDAVARDQDGNILLADIQLMQINVVSAAGELTTVLGRQGEGPGEVTRLGGVVPLPDGTVGLVQLMPGRVVKVDGSGLPAGEIVPRWLAEGGRLMLADMQLAGQRLVAAGRRMTRREEVFMMDLWIAELSDDGSVGTIFYREQRERNLSSGVFSELDTDWAGEGRWTATTDGRVIVAPERDVYRLEMYGPEGLERVVTRAFTTRERTEQEKDAVRSRLGRFRGRGRNRGMASMEVEVADTAPAIVQLHAMPDGEVWVLTSRSDRDQPAGVMLTYDEIDPVGNFTRQIAVACEGVADQDALFPLGGGEFVLIKGHAGAMAAMRGAETENADADLDDAAPLEIVGLRAVAQP